MNRPSRRDAQAAALGNQQAANDLRQQGREREARCAEAAAQDWRDYLTQLPGGSR